jgi:hypothetical protein
VYKALHLHPWERGFVVLSDETDTGPGVSGLVSVTRGFPWPMNAKALRNLVLGK